MIGDYGQGGLSSTHLAGMAIRGCVAIASRSGFSWRRLSQRRVWLAAPSAFAGWLPVWTRVPDRRKPLGHVVDLANLRKARRSQAERDLRGGGQRQPEQSVVQDTGRGGLRQGRAVPGQVRVADQRSGRHAEPARARTLGQPYPQFGGTPARGGAV